MIYIPDYIIELQEGAVKCLFNTRALRRYCEAKGLELSDFYLKIQKTLTLPADYTEAMHGVKDFVHSDLPELLEYGYESWCAYNKEPFFGGDLQKDLWIDSLGGIAGQQQAFAAIVLAIASRMVSTTEKKRVNGASLLAGGNSLNSA